MESRRQKISNWQICSEEGFCRMEKKPSPIRRAYIPKPNGKKRPLGIPTIIDMVNQDILRMTIEPITEYHFQDCSYGFRPKRCCQDAIEHIFIKMATRNRHRWVIEGDIKGCFDNISHDKDGVVEDTPNVKDSGYTDNVSGTPQGGILSPMLANVALTILDEWGQHTRKLIQSSDMQMISS